MRVICGLQPVREAIRAHGPKLKRVLLEQTRPESPVLAAVARFAADRGVRVDMGTRSELDRLAEGGRHQGAIAVAEELALIPLSELDLGPKSLLVVLDELEDPQNFGAIVRSAVAMGATGIIWPEHRSAPLSAATFRASAGAVEHATLCRVSSIPHALQTLASAGVLTVGLDADGPVMISSVELTGPLALVVGAEGKGLRKTVKSACEHLVSLPMNGPIASLNASVAAAIALYEVVRQRSSQE